VRSLVVRTIIFLVCTVAAAVGCASDSGPDPVPFVSWAASAGGAGRDAATGVAVDADGAVFVTGRFSDQATFGQGGPEATLLSAADVADGVDQDAFVARYSPDGALEWAVSAGGMGPDEGHALAIASDGSVLVTGRFADGAVFGAWGASEAVLDAEHGDQFLARYEQSGALRWARATAGDWSAGEGCSGGRLAALDDGSVVVKGTFSGDAVFGAGEPGETLLQAQGTRDDFLARYGADGWLMWARRLGGSGGWGGVTVLDDGRLAVSGAFEWEALFGEGEPGEVRLASFGVEDVYVAVLTADGDLVWAEHAGSSGWEASTGVAALPGGSFLASGFFWESITFDYEEPGQVTLSSEGADTSFVVEYDADGAVDLAIQIGGKGWVDTCAIATLSSGAFVLGGWFGDVAPALFGDGEAGEIVLDSTGGEDGFAAVYGADGSLTRVASMGATGTGAFDERCHGVAPVPDGSFVAVGAFEGPRTRIGEPGGATVELVSSGGSDVFVARFLP
jgi:hypothetical protein